MRLSAHSADKEDAVLPLLFRQLCAAKHKDSLQVETKAALAQRVKQVFDMRLYLLEGNRDDFLCCFV